MKNTLLIPFIVLSLFVISCTPSRDKMLEKISTLESKMKSTQNVDSISINKLLEAYQDFATNYPKDSLASENLYKAAGLAVGFNKGTQAIGFYESIINTYPSYIKIPECYFMKAFTYENVMGDVVKANEFYNKFLAKYPDHELADDATSAIKYLGKSPEEMVREFEKMNNDSIATAAK